MLTKNFALLSQRVKEHVEADSIIQSIYWNPVTMRGCFIGCLARVDNPSVATIYNEKTYGLPISLQRIAENIFEELPPMEAKKFFASLPEAIGQDGKDLTNIHWKFLASELRNIPPQAVEIQTIIDQVIDGMDLLSRGQSWNAAEIAKAARAAGAAANSAAVAAAYAAAWADAAAEAALDVAAVEAVDAAAVAADWAAEAAALAAARAAAEASYWDAWAAAYEASKLRQRDSLLRLIKEAPVKPI